MYNLLYNARRRVYSVRRDPPRFSHKCVHLVVRGCFEHLTEINENLNKELPIIRLTKLNQKIKRKQSEIDEEKKALIPLKDNISVDENFKEASIILEKYDINNNNSQRERGFCDVDPNAKMNDTVAVLELLEHVKMEINNNSMGSLPIDDSSTIDPNLGTATVFPVECNNIAEDSNNNLNFQAIAASTGKVDDSLENHFCSDDDIDNSKIIGTKVVNKSSENTNNFDTIMERELGTDIEDKQLLLSKLISHEDDLVDIAFLPTELAEIEKIYSAEQDLSNYKTSYIISDRLETILSAQFNSDKVESVRHNDSDYNNFSLSPVALRPREKYSVVDNSSFNSKSHEITVDSSFFTTHELSHSMDDINDKNFDPSDFKHSSAISIECHQEPNPPNNDLVQPSYQTQNDDCSNKTSNNFGEIPPNPNIAYNGSSSKLFYTQEGSCDNTALKVQIFDNTPRWRKKYACPLCNKSVCKLPRHMETVHAKDDTAKKLKDADKGTAERKQILDIIRKGGSFKHNTDPNRNNGTLYVTRRPRLERPATDYITCPNCFVTLTKSNARKHISKCLPYETGGSRAYLVLGRKVEGRLHKTASETLKLVVFPVLREDDIVRLIRYDWLIILYGNKLCLKYTPHYQHNMVRARLRLIGRFLYAAKEKNKDLRELADIFIPKYVSTVVDAIKVVARIDHLKNSCETPAVALNLVTHIKQIAHLLETEYVIKENKEGQEQVINFLKVYSTEMPISINKIAMEADAKAKRQKIIVLPMTDDINKLILYLKNERKQCFSNLSNKYDLLEWLNGLKLVAIYLLVFNRRRVGDIQNILLSDYEHLENIDMSADKEEFDALDAEGKEIAKKYKRIRIRGKRGRIVSVIMNSDVIRELDLLIKYRRNSGVPQNNDFLFGLPSTIEDRIRVIDLCIEMPKVAILCGANKPKLLRGTGLRKHIATKCIELELKDTEVAGVAGHLGHSDKIHHAHYRLPPKSRTIVQITKVLQAVQGDFDEDESDDENDHVNNQHEFLKNRNGSDSELHSITDEETSFCSPKLSTPNTSLSYEKNSDKSMDNKMIEKKGKKRWSDVEKEVVMTSFRHCFQERTLPTLKEIDKIKKSHSCLKDRPRQTIKTWISNQLKTPETRTKNKPKVVNNRKVNFTFKIKRRADEEYCNK